MKATGVFRDAGDERALSVIFDSVPTDDQMRAVHDFLRSEPAICPFCSKPTYALPCTSCGEPDIPDPDF